ncbi:MAG: hypothetical protein GH151_13655 [Bacteroidetes bacterium]|nr:hypothetical protein [Bacteroidota bacterium]
MRIVHKDYFGAYKIIYRRVDLKKKTGIQQFHMSKQGEESLGWVWKAMLYEVESRQ